MRKAELHLKEQLTCGRIEWYLKTSTIIKPDEFYEEFSKLVKLCWDSDISLNCVIPSDNLIKWLKTDLELIQSRLIEVDALDIEDLYTYGDIFELRGRDGYMLTLLEFEVDGHGKCYATINFIDYVRGNRWSKSRLVERESRLYTLKELHNIFECGDENVIVPSKKKLKLV